MSGSTKSHGSHRRSHHMHLFEIHETIDASFIAFVSKRHVFQKQRHEWYDWRL